MRLRLDLAYDGTDFHGWASQPGLRTVEGTLAESLAQVLRLQSVDLTCAGRTDSGVHARGQVVHLDVAEPDLAAAAGRSTTTPVDALTRRLNRVLPADVRIHGCRGAPTGFDARFSAAWRRYAYRVADAGPAIDPLARRHVLAWPHRLDELAMSQAAVALTGEHDFAAFCKRRAGRSTRRNLRELAWTREPGGLLVASVRADAFCHHMVRSLVGSLLAVGEHRRPVEWPAEMLQRRERDPRVRVAPPHGLTLEEVGYPPDEEIAAQERASRQRSDVATHDG